MAAERIVARMHWAWHTALPRPDGWRHRPKGSGGVWMWKPAGYGTMTATALRGSLYWWEWSRALRLMPAPRPA